MHYPFENKEWFDEHFPADFITEYIAQTRGWFNTLITLSTALFDKIPFKNCICHGVVIDAETGLKYSKRLKNYTDPKEVFDKYGADALRWLMLSSPVLRGADLAVDAEGAFIRDIVRLHIKPIWNAYNFFTLYANADGVKAKLINDSESQLDRYILAKLQEAVGAIDMALTVYDTPNACNEVTLFFESLNNWYIRRSRERFWKADLDGDKQSAYDTLYTVLHTMCRAAAPLLPFTLESIFRGLEGVTSSSSALSASRGSGSTHEIPEIGEADSGMTGVETSSVHLQEFPTQERAIEYDIVHDMERVRDACNVILSVRNETNIRIRQPLSSATLYGAGAERLQAFAELIQDEGNIKAIHFSDDLESIADHVLTVNFKVAGKRLGAKMKAIGAAAKQGDWSKNADGAMVVGGEMLEPQEYSLQLKAKASATSNGAAQALASNDAILVLDTEITPELAQEGLARDVVRAIQQARKDADLDMSDRIALKISGAGDVMEAVATHRDYIAAQTLASDIAEGAGLPSDFVSEQKIGEAMVSFSLAAITKAA